MQSLGPVEISELRSSGAHPLRGSRRACYLKKGEEEAKLEEANTLVSPGLNHTQ